MAQGSSMFMSVLSLPYTCPSHSGGPGPGAIRAMQRPPMADTRIEHLPPYSKSLAKASSWPVSNLKGWEESLWKNVQNPMTKKTLDKGSASWHNELKELATKPDDLGLNSTTHIVEAKDRLLQLVP